MVYVVGWWIECWEVIEAGKIIGFGYKANIRKYTPCLRAPSAYFNDVLCRLEYVPQPPWSLIGQFVCSFSAGHAWCATEMGHLIVTGIYKGIMVTISRWFVWHSRCPYTLIWTKIISVFRGEKLISCSPRTWSNNIERPLSGWWRYLWLGMAIKCVCLSVAHSISCVIFSSCSSLCRLRNDPSIVGLRLRA